jgi:large subunit ribosomal protein L10
MNRHQKEAVVTDFQEMFEKAKATFLVNYRGVIVADMQKLRRGLREQEAILKITKARLMKIATQQIDSIDEFRNNFKDQIGLVFAMGEVPAAAKTLIDFSKESKSFKILSGFFGNRVIDKQQIDLLASLPSQDILLAQVVGTLQAPIAGLTRVLHLLVVRLLHTLQQAADKKGQE